MLPCVANLGSLEIHLFYKENCGFMAEQTYMEMSQMFLCGLLSSSINGGYKEMPTSVKQTFVTSDFTVACFIYRKVAFCWCLSVPVDGGHLVLCDLSSANMRLLTLVMTTLGQV